MRQYKHLLICCALLGNFLSCFSQVANPPSYDMPKFMPPSPTAVAFARYGEVPVDISTGVPEIEIPLYTITSRKLQIPLALSYHASGIKVEDVSTVVGLGWVLKGMGLVSRNVLDLHDDRLPEGPNMYNKATYKSKADYDLAVANASTDYKKSQVARELESDLNKKDKKSDRFNFQLPGKGSGTFRYDFINGNCVVVPYQPVKIEKIMDTSQATAFYDGEIASFKIHDNEGNIYVYNLAYQTILNNTFRDVANTSWYLTQIISADGTDQIIYSYGTFNQNTNVSVSHSVRWNRGIGPCSDSNPNPYGIPDYNYYMDYEYVKEFQTQEPLLTSITSETTSVYFDYTADRTDTPGSPYRLSGIRVLDKQNNNKVIKEVNLDNKNNFAGGRLQLAGVTIKGNVGQPDQVYKMDYQGGMLPAPLTRNYLTQPGHVFQTDYWGYYNGALNQGLIPYEFLPCLSYASASCRTGHGGTRKANHFYASAGLINSIQYPTGGKTTFTFEPNVAPVYSVQGGFDSAPVGGFRIRSIQSDNMTKTYTYPGVAAANPVFRDMFQNTVPVYYLFHDECDFIGKLVVNMFPSIVTQSSPYTAISLNNGGVVVYPTVIEYLGTESNNIGKTEYNYSFPDVSTPIVNPDTEDEINTPKYFGDYYRDNGPFQPQLLSKRTYENNGGVYTLKHELINTYQTYRDDEFSTGVNVVKELEENDDKFRDYIVPIEIYDGYPGYINQFSYLDTKAQQKVSLLSGSEEKTYEGSGYNSVITNYTYNDLNLAVAVKTEVSSEGETKKTILKYPNDFTADAACVEMVNRNVVMPVIESQTYKDQTPLETIHTTYDIQPSNVIAPIQVARAQGANLSEVRLRYHGYDSKGNVLEVSRENDIHVAYIWGYSNIYPIAQVTNASYTNIFHTSFEDGTGVAFSNAKTGRNVGSATFTKTLSTLSNGKYILEYWKWETANLLWTKVPLEVTVTNSTNGTNGTYSINIVEGSYIDEVRFYPADAQMITNTYEPLVGVSSTTDAAGTTTYYEYDHAGRFSVLRDYANNIIKKIGYSINGNPEDPIPGAFYNEYKSTTITADNCNTGYVGAPFLYEVPAGKFSSMENQVVANQLAQNDMDVNAQGTANLYGGCIPKFTNVEKNGTFNKTNCGAGFTGGAYTYTVYAGTYRGTTQEAADQLALDDIAANGQNVANSSNAPCLGTNWPYAYFSYENDHIEIITDTKGVQHENNYADVTVKFFTSAAMTTTVQPSNVVLNFRRDIYTSTSYGTDYPSVTASAQTVVVFPHMITFGYDANGNSVETQIYLQPGDGYNLITAH